MVGLKKNLKRSAVIVLLKDMLHFDVHYARMRLIIVSFLFEKRFPLSEIRYEGQSHKNSTLAQSRG